MAESRPDTDGPDTVHIPRRECAGVAGRKKTVMCRCKRAWLPPSATWLFPPRSAKHAMGGWYLEWGGYKHRDHPL